MRHRRILQDLNRQLILDAPLVDPDPALFQEPKGTEVWTYHLGGEAVERLIIYLRSDLGCEYGRKTGGCTGCRHWRIGTAGVRVEGSDIYWHQYLAAIAKDGVRPVVCLYNEGNVLNDRELPNDQLLRIVDHMRSCGVRRVVLESRPEYVTDAVLADLTTAAGPMEIEVGIGLESANDFIRNELFLKSTTLRGYERSIAKLRKYGMRSLAYVILKPSFLNEVQAIRDSLETARYAFDVGTDVVSFEPIGIEPHTVCEMMYEDGLYQPPWLWSALRVALDAHPLGEIRIGGYQYSPPPEHFPKNCDRCTSGVLEAIDVFNHTYDVSVLEELRCGACYREYQDYLVDQDPDIDETAIYAGLRAFVEAAHLPQ